MRRTDGDHLQMPWLHFLLQHRTIRHNLLDIREIVISSDYLATRKMKEDKSEKDWTVTQMDQGSRTRVEPSFSSKEH